MSCPHGNPIGGCDTCDEVDAAFEAGKRSALAEQPAQQEPVECKTLCELCVKRGYHFCANAAQTTPIPSPQASKPWVGLTDEQISDLWDGHTVPVFGKTGINPIVFARAIEAAHGIKEEA